jgi:capsule polysaccharide export protein KpsE/RkpR
MLPTTFRSTTLLMPPEEQGGAKAGLAMMASMATGKLGGSGGGGGSDLGMLAGDLLGMKSSGELYVGILRSRSVQGGLVDQFDLTSVYGIPWFHLRIQHEDACKQLESNTEASQDRKSGMITIAVADRDPKRAAALADGYVDQLNRLLARVSTSAAGREREFLERRLVEVKKDLDESMAQLGQFSSNNRTFDPQIQSKATVESVATLEGQLIAAESQLKGLQAIYTAENVRVRSLQARVSELKKQLSALSGTSSLDSSTDSLDPDMPFPSLRQLPLLGEKYADLLLRAKIEETVYQILTQQFEIAKVQEAKEIPTVRVVDKAEIPLRKWGPHRALLTLLGAFLGVLFASVGLIGRDSWERWDANAPRKVFLSESYGQIRMTRAARWIASRFHKSNQPKSRVNEWDNNGSQ